MKKTALLTIVLAMALSLALAQEPGKPMPAPVQKHENAHPSKQGDCMEPRPIDPMMIKMKREFIQENFVIESGQKEAFWNAYNEYEKELITAHKEQREFRKKNSIPTRMTADSISNLSDETILIYYENNFETKNRLFKAEENFFKNLKGILKPQQIAQYYILERNFHKSATKMGNPKMMKMEQKPMKTEALPADKIQQAPAKKHSGSNY